MAEYPETSNVRVGAAPKEVAAGVRGSAVGARGGWGVPHPVGQLLVVDAAHAVFVGDLFDLGGEVVDVPQAVGEEVGLKLLPERLVDTLPAGGELRRGVRSGFEGGERLRVWVCGGLLVGPVEVAKGVVVYVVHGVWFHGVVGVVVGLEVSMGG